MQPARNQARAPGSFAPLPPISSSSTSSSNHASNIDLPSSSRPRPHRVASASSDESFAPPALNLSKARSSPQPPYGFTQQANSSTPSLQNFSRPTLLPSNSNTAAAAAAAARAGAGGSSSGSRSGSPLTLPEGRIRAHSRKHSQTAGLFDSTLPSTSVSNLSQIGMAAQGGPSVHQHRELSASQIAAQAAVMHHQNQQQHQQPHLQHQQQHQQQQHARQRSQTVPVPGEPYDNLPPTNKRGSGGPLSPPMLSLTEASAPRDHGFGNPGYHNGLLGNQKTAAQAAASVAFPRSGQSSPGLPSQIQIPTPPPPPPPLPERKPEKSKVKLFSRPGKIGTKGEPKEKPLPSPSKIGSALASLQRGNFSTTSLDSSSQSFYSLGNSSSATIRAVDTPPAEGKEKEKKHHFLSRQKHKLKDKDEFHLPLSSASSNSRPTDPNAPSSLYNFNLPPSPGPSTTFKSVSGLDLRHGGRALREQKEKAKAAESTTTLQSDFGPSSLTSSSGPSTVFLSDSLDSSKTGLSNMSMDDAWPFLKAKLLVVFQGEDLRLPVEDFNRVVMVHIQYCIQRRSPNIIIDDLRELLSTGFSSLDLALRKTPEDKLIPGLVELWVFTFTSILPYMQAVFLPLDLEFQGAGPLLPGDKARDFWGGVIAPSVADPARPFANIAPVAAILDVRRLVLTAYRDTVIMPRYEKLKTMFSRLSLEFLPGSGYFSAGAPGGSGVGSAAAGGAPLAASPIPIQSQQDLFSAAAAAHQFGTSPSGDSTGSYPLRPGTAMSLDPSVASYNSTSTTLLGDGGSAGGGGGGSRAISNVSFGSSGASDPRPFTPGGGVGLPQQQQGSFAGTTGTTLRELQNVDDGKAVTDMVGRMLQCMSVLASVGVAGSGGGDEGTRAVEELSRLLKLNWLGRGRTGRNRRGIVGGRVRRVGAEQPPVREEVSVV
ncbi:uncharacterized protein E0L32_010957 [Thyridium curvatum]|uniref:HbrB-like protein n=1 Tax=Thyridium curvatum TaxID=1093900 RepID=A0A507AL62_9PEZI|nr:uncharacterized protein E0L32_010957 [Thyridium curvatum]TPX07156.1 hypothetical protein E0L32_010957 [Thyridium curvatum]